MITKSEMGKRSKAKGARFELKVRKDLEKEGWIVDKWSNNVEIDIPPASGSKIAQVTAKLILTKPKFIWNPRTKQRQMIGNSSGFPDFIAFKVGLGNVTEGLITYNLLYQIVGVECKTNGYLDRAEKEKCKWLLDNDIFGTIWIAKEGKKRGEIEYIDFEEKYG